jgi:hypothetical protein
MRPIPPMPTTLPQKPKLPASSPPPPGPPAALPEPAPLPAPKEASPAVLAAMDLADKYNIDVTLEAATNFASFRAALWEKHLLRQQFPAVPPAYQPSGRVSAEGYRNLLSGALLAALVNLPIVSLFVLVVGVLLIGLSSQGIVRHFVVAVLGGLASLLVFVLVPLATGYLSGTITAEMGKVGKNRSPAAAAGFSIGATAAAGLVGVALLWLSPYHSGLLWVECLLFFWFFVLASVMAALVAVRNVKAARFCERCEVHMKQKPLRSLCLGGLRLILRALRQHDLLAVAGAAEVARRGHTCQQQLFWCPECGRGYLEVHAHFVATWQTRASKDRPHRSTWRVASEPLTTNEMRLIDLSNAP